MFHTSLRGSIGHQTAFNACMSRNPQYLDSNFEQAQFFRGKYAWSNQLTLLGNLLGPDKVFLKPVKHLKA